MTKKALLVGINSYKNPSANLRGCLNDIALMSNILIRNYGFDPGNIRMLADERATKPAIVERLRWLVEGLAPGDSAVFHYSGHGSLIVLRDPKTGRVADQQQPIICSYELDWNAPLTFREIGQLLVAPEGVNITSILDCCHSGHDFRDVSQDNPFFPRTASKNPDVRYRFLTPPIDIAHRAISVNQPRASVPLRLSDQTDILMTGCQVVQTSADAFIKGSYRGAFTYCLSQALAELKYTANYVNVLARTRQILKQMGYSQTPQLEGAMKLSTWPMFGVPKV